MRAWVPCAVLAAVMLAAHLAACPHEWHVVLGGMVVGIAAVVGASRPSISGDVERARRLALDEEGQGPAGTVASWAPVRPEHPRPLEAWVPITFAALAVILVAASAVLALSTARREREAPRHVAPLGERAGHERQGW